MNSTRLAFNSARQRSFIASSARRACVRPSLGLCSRKGFLHSQIARYQPAIIILASQRYLSTDTATTGVGGPVIPPPGFDPKKASKPVPRETVIAKPSARPETAAAPRNSTVEASALEKKGPEASQTESSTAVTTASESGVVEKKEEKKATIWQKVKHGVQHFWDGTKLLGAEIKISSNLALKMAAGYELSRRERRQLERTVRDLGRLVPFSVFIIVPAGELFLPIALKVFPNLLPSTYEDQKAKDLKSSKLRSTRRDVSDFLRKTLRESGIPFSAKTRQREEFTQFFRKIRSSGESPSREDVIKVCKIFRDDVTLDNLSRPQLVGMCRYMNLNTFGTDAMLRYNIRHRMRQIKRDDRAISYEGVDSLSVLELQAACASRGIRTYGVSPGRLRDDLNTWLELRLKHGLPSTLLVLSNAFMYAKGKESEIDSQFDALVAVLSSIPEELYHEIELEVNTLEGAATNKQRLEVLKEQQELIEEENEQSSKSTSEASKKASKDDQNIDEKEASTPDASEGAGAEVEAKELQTAAEKVASAEAKGRKEA
ncbi:LETM1-domain-containing protein [Tuber magnatum]|uniref:LETM1-domain-containing protein n=1 Tax=Tuber magnatum TaxID=42249 RepID=A0A317SWV4_9PEZI|nr:LETM1-domain-containing protein [Tuber magnatum]